MARPLAWVLALAAAVRLASLLQFASLPFFTHHRLDAALYHDVARTFATGDVLLGREVLHMSPLHAAFLGTQYAIFGMGPWVPRLVQLLLGLGIVLMVHDATRRLLDRRWALGAALATALYGPLVFYEHQLHVATLATAANTAVLWLAVVIATGDRRRRVALTLGIAWGLAILARPNALLLGLAVLPATMLTGPAGLRSRMGRFAVVTAVATACVLPVTARNVAVAGEWVPVTDSGGLNLYLGNGPGANGMFRIPPEIPEARNAQSQFAAFTAFAERERGRSLTAREVDGFWMRRTADHIAAQPKTFALVLARKVQLYWSAQELANTHDFAFHRELMPALWLAPVGFGWIGGLALVGIGFALRRRRPGDLVVAGFNLAGCAALVAFFVLSHYRATFVPGLLLAATLGLHALAAAWRSGRRGAAALTALAAAAFSVWASVPVFDPPRSEEWRKLGFAYHEAKQLDDAARAYTRAIELEPTNVSAHKNLAIARHQQGDLAAARTHWSAVLRLARHASDGPRVQEAQRALATIAAQLAPSTRRTVPQAGP